MPRTARASRGNWCYHVLNRGNGRAEVFHKEEDYAAFVRLFEPACERLPMRLVGWCLMPNHFHLVLWPHGDGDLGRWMQWLLTSHVRRYHRHYHGSGHVWQGRFKAFPIQRDEHFLTVLRYIERNPLRSGLVERAEDWQWSSLRCRLPKADCPWLGASPVALPTNWLSIVNRAQSEAEIEAVRRSIARGAPFGTESWVKIAAKRLALQATIRPRGRPRKSKK
jgi:putative transposase